MYPQPSQLGHSTKRESDIDWHASTAQEGRTSSSRSCTLTSQRETCKACLKMFLVSWSELNMLEIVEETFASAGQWTWWSWTFNTIPHWASTDGNVILCKHVTVTEYCMTTLLARAVNDVQPLSMLSDRLRSRIHWRSYWIPEINSKTITVSQEKSKSICHDAWHLVTMMPWCHE